MHVLFVHQNFPAQFGHIARHLIRTRGWTCTFVSKTPAGRVDGIEKVAYTTTSGARETTHYCSRTFENAVWHAHGVYEACKARPDLRPDLIVGHSGFGSTVYLPELYPGRADHQLLRVLLSSAPSRTWTFARVSAVGARLPARTVAERDALARPGDLPARLQPDAFPAASFSRRSIGPRSTSSSTGSRPISSGAAKAFPAGSATASIPASTRIVTYVSRGFEAMRGFDIFMKVAKRIYEQYPDVVFVVVGSDRVCYGGDEKHIEHKTFREHVMAQSDYDHEQVHLHGAVAGLEAGRSVEHLRPASLFHRPVRAELVDDGRPGLRLHRAGIRHRAGARDDRRRPERAALRLLRRRGVCGQSRRGAARPASIPAPGARRPSSASASSTRSTSFCRGCARLFEETVAGDQADLGSIGSRNGAGEHQNKLDIAMLIPDGISGGMLTIGGPTCRL